MLGFTFLLGEFCGILVLHADVKLVVNTFVACEVHITDIPQKTIVEVSTGVAIVENSKFLTLAFIPADGIVFGGARCHCQATGQDGGQHP